MHEQRRRAMEVGKQQLKQRNDEANNEYEQINQQAAENRMSVVRRILEFWPGLRQKVRYDSRNPSIPLLRSRVAARSKDAAMHHASMHACCQLLSVIISLISS